MEARPPIYHAPDNHIYREGICTECRIGNHAERTLLSTHTIFQNFQEQVLEQGTTSIYELFLEAWAIQPFKALAYKNFQLMDWNIEANHYNLLSGYTSALHTRLFWRLYGDSIKILTLSHCKIPFNFTFLPNVLWRAVPNLENLTLSNCVMEMNTAEELGLETLETRQSDSSHLAIYPVKLRVLLLHNVTCILDAGFLIEWCGIMQMLSNLEDVYVRQREFEAAMNFFDFLKLMPNETIWQKPFNLRWTGIMNWPKLESNGLTWNLRNWLTRVELTNDMINVHFSQTGFQGLKNLHGRSVRTVYPRRV